MQSFGFMVAMSFLLANYTMTLEMKRKERNGILKPVKAKISPESEAKQRRSDLIGAIVLGFLLGLKFIPLIQGEVDTDLPSFLMSAKGSFGGGIVLAIILGGYQYWRQRKAPLPTQTKEIEVHPYEIMGNLTVAAAIAGLAGAKVFHNLENWSEFIQDPIGNLLAFSGLTFYGGLIVGGGAVLYMAAKKGIHWRHMLDIGAPAMMLAYGVGRIGCQVSGDGDWGIVNTSAKPGWLSWAPDWFWSYTYPNNVLKEGVPIDGCVGEYCYQLAEGVYPTPLYEAIVCISLFFLLWALRTRIQIPGVLFSTYLIMNGFERFMIEKIRVNNKMDFLGMSLTQAEIISFALILLGAIGIVYFRKKPLNQA
ncbi:MAG: prolipoprotein diacylglyceryl transferase [Bacteroidota bacterium]|nr:prolipoprotein diacylglyceryl transferase [Bacteroidota bacterium]MDX5430334.1 prolipoprotein diacylglyceryl transferase [Bacteroidota bacterium]MDX5469095.1 prolipoprotein diacylglyceryl transferase [Bacteroidota bacterium]